MNSRGEFNVPFGRYKNPKNYNRENLITVHKILRDDSRIRLLCTDFQDAVKDAGEDDFIYFDPPYQPLSDTTSFTEYTPGGFGYREQIRFSNVFKELADRGSYVMLSNSNKEEVLKT